MRLLRFLIIPLILLLLCYGFKMRLGHYFSPSTTGLQALYAQKEIDYLFIGSSLTRQSLNPYGLDSLSPKCYILSYNGMQPYYLGILLRDITENKKIKIKNLILEAYPYKVYEPPMMVDSRMFHEADYSLKNKLLASSSFILSSWEKYELIFLQNNESILAYPLLHTPTDRLSYKGGTLKQEQDAISLSDFKQIQPPYADTLSYKGLNALQKRVLQITSQLAKKHGINLYFLEPSVPCVVERSKIFESAHYDLKAYIENDLKRLYFSNGDSYRFDNDNPNYFHDRVHLSAKGRNLYTKKIVHLLKTIGARAPKAVAKSSDNLPNVGEQ